MFRLEIADVMQGDKMEVQIASILSSAAGFEPDKNV